MGRMKQYIITNTELRDVSHIKGQYVQIVKNLTNPRAISSPHDAEYIDKCEYETEIIKLMRYVTPEGSYRLGLSRDVQEALGMYIDVFLEMQQRDAWSSERLRNVHSVTKNATLWTRIKWVFTGVKI